MDKKLLHSHGLNTFIYSSRSPNQPYPYGHKKLADPLRTVGQHRLVIFEMFWCLLIERQRSRGRSRGTPLPAVFLTEATSVCNTQRQTAAASRVIWSTVSPVVASVVWMYVAAIAASRQRRSFCAAICQSGGSARTAPSDVIQKQPTYND